MIKQITLIKERISKRIGVNEMRTKKVAAVAMSVMCVAGLMTGCGSNKEAATSGNASDAGSGATSQTISVVSREDGSGTRGAFVELTGVQEKDADGNKIDNTTVDAILTNSTEIMMTTVSGDEYAIGYSSTGSLNDTVKALTIDGVEPTADNIKNGYIAVADDAEAFKTNKATGKIVVAGSSSVTPVMEKLSEAYQSLNTGAKIEIQESDSTTGMTAAADGTCDIGMASRELDSSETDAGLNATAIAMDGIAVIVNANNAISDINLDTVKSIFTGETTDWADVTK